MLWFLVGVSWRALFFVATADNLFASRPNVPRDDMQFNPADISASLLLSRNTLLVSQVVCIMVLRHYSFVPRPAFSSVAVDLQATLGSEHS